MLIYPHFNKIALEIGPIKIYWYGIMYLLSFITAWLLGRYRIIKKKPQGWNIIQLDDLIFYCALGVVIGGRIGQMLFYDYANFFYNPLIFFKVWQGGMSFHGGVLGVVLSCLLFAKKYHKKFFEVTDFIVPLVPLGLAFGRLGNFINGELWGRVADVPWAMAFPDAGPLPRHPSQLYEFLLEGIFLFILLWIYSSRKRPTMAVSALFMLSYGIIRFFVEFYREPELQYGYNFVAFDWLTMGQLLSLPMIAVGIIMFFKIYKWDD